VLFSGRRRAGKASLPIAQTTWENRHGNNVSHAYMEQPLDTSSARRELDDLFSTAYEELRRLASTVRRSYPTTALSPTTLVNQAWIKLAASPRFQAMSPLHFKRIAARAMRQVLVEAARTKQADKRGGDVAFLALDESIAGDETARDILALDSALADLSRLQPRQADMVEYRFFGGLDVAETAELLGVSEATVLRDWRAAKAWLAKELRGPR
jgi:RNA polymerase sigma factor (TIGR02999 family)